MIDGRLFIATSTGWLLLNPADGRTATWHGTTDYRLPNSASPCGQFVLEYDSPGVLHCWRLREDGLGLHRELVWSRPRALISAAPLFAPDAERFAVCSWRPDQELRPWTVYRTADGQPLTQLEGRESLYYWSLFTPNGGMLLAGAKSRAHEWDARADGAGRLAVQHPNTRYFRGVAVHPGGTVLAGVTSDGVSLFDLAGGGLLRKYDWEFGYLKHVAFTPDGTRCVVAGASGQVLLFDVE